MLFSKTKQFTIAGLTSAVLSFSAQAAQWDITITNLTHGNYFTPLLVAAHDESTHLYQTGHMASSSLQAMAECGDISGLVADLGSTADVEENPANGFLAPGTSTMLTLMPMMDNAYLSIAAMMLPTNDGFVGMNGTQIPTTSGTYTFYLNAYDAGTEANNELMDTSGCAPGLAGIPGAPGGDVGMNGTGFATTDSNAMVHIHRGTLGDTDASAGASDLDSTIHRWQNPVAKVTIMVTP